MTVKLRTCLWFNGKTEEAAAFYVKLLPESEIQQVARPTPDAPALMVDFMLSGAPYQALNGGPGKKFSPAASISVLTDDQDETDKLWGALTKGGSPGRCGWLKDRYGMSWQIVSRALGDLISAADPAAAARVALALSSMGKIDLTELEAARRGA